VSPERRVLVTSRVPPSHRWSLARLIAEVSGPSLDEGSGPPRCPRVGRSRMGPPRQTLEPLPEADCAPERREREEVERRE
jgi:hypothetical protein